ncbi:MAG: response regulator transcription factor [Candidatus Omnitrophica bacterium]|nr:response regulator transcription factor [Candidatus Omnitrophota bacterium]
MFNKRVMIVDDDAVFADELKDVLAFNGYETIVENDSMMAVKSVGHFNPGVVLLDINMPIKNGFDIANALRYGEKNSKVFIIVITGSHKPAYDQIFKMYGIDRCLQKPFSPEELIAMIEGADELTPDLK